MPTSANQDRAARTEAGQMQALRGAWHSRLCLPPGFRHVEPCRSEFTNSLSLFRMLRILVLVAGSIF